MTASRARKAAAGCRNCLSKFLAPMRHSSLSNEFPTRNRLTRLRTDGDHSACRGFATKVNSRGVALARFVAIVTGSPVVAQSLRSVAHQVCTGSDRLPSQTYIASHAAARSSAYESWQFRCLPQRLRDSFHFSGEAVASTSLQRTFDTRWQYE